MLIVFFSEDGGGGRRVSKSSGSKVSNIVRWRGSKTVKSCSRHLSLYQGLSVQFVNTNHPKLDNSSRFYMHEAGFVMVGTDIWAVAICNQAYLNEAPIDSSSAIVFASFGAAFPRRSSILHHHFETCKRSLYRGPSSLNCATATVISKNANRRIPRIEFPILPLAVLRIPNPLNAHRLSTLLRHMMPLISHTYQTEHRAVSAQIYTALYRYDENTLGNRGCSCNEKEKQRERERHSERARVQPKADS